MRKGEKVNIRPVRRDDIGLLDSWNNDVEIEGHFNDFGFEGNTGMMAGFEKTGLIDDQHASIVIEDKTGNIVGLLSYYTVVYGPKPVHKVFGIGIHLVPEARGKGYGAEAQALLAAYLFDTYPIARVEASTDVENIAEQRSLEKAGFTREGVLRKAQWRKGEFHDLILYSKLRGE